MIGPKQFDIRHKTKPKRDFDNPIVNKIFAPMFRYREDDLDDLIGEFESDLKDRVESFLDKFKAPMFEHKEEDITPENKQHPKKRSKISDETINQITYKVFQNIKEYLDKDNKISSGRKGIKLEIDL
jgi:ribosomal protein S18